ncbi:MAG: hypothetical protein WDA75_00110, partial [Candidatus Latescibacterota bacterium]
MWTYESLTLTSGEGELETYFTLSSPDKGALEGRTSVEHQVELEVGMSERLDCGLYQVFGQAPGEALTYEGYKLRGRYRLGPPGERRL